MLASILERHIIVEKLLADHSILFMNCLINFCHVTFQILGKCRAVYIYFNGTLNGHNTNGIMSMVNLTLSLHNIMDLNLESLAFVMAISSSNLLLKNPAFTVLF